MLNSNNEEIILQEEKIEKSLNYDLLEVEEKKKVDELVDTIEVTNTNQIIQFASSVQGKMVDFSDSVLQNVRTQNAGEVGEVLTQLVSEINDFDAVAESKNNNIFSKIFKRAKNDVEKLVAKYSKVETNVDRIVSNLEKNRIQMMKDLVIFEDMFNKNAEFFKEISLYIIAAEKKLKEIKEVEIPRLKEIAQNSNEQMDAQAVNDMVESANRLDKKITDLKLTRMISIQMAPQIRMMQVNESELVEKIQSTISNTIPLWKSQLLLALGITNSKIAYEAQNSVTEATNNLLKKNSELLKQGSIDIAKASERSIVDMETLKQTNANIISTIEEVIQIHTDGAEKRRLAEVELTNIENELKNKLSEIRG